MINLITIGLDKGNITLNALKAIEEADLIFNHGIDLSYYDDYIKDKEIISTFNNNLSNILDDNLSDGLSNGVGGSANVDVGSAGIVAGVGGSANGGDASDVANLEDITEDNSINNDLIKLYSQIELAILESLEKNVVFISSNSEIYNVANIIIQISSKFNNIKLKIHPSVSNLDYASSILGSPLNDFVSINLNNPIVSLTEIKDKIKYALDNNLVLVISNLINICSDNSNVSFDLLKNIIMDFNKNLLVGLVNPNSHEIFKFKDISEKKIFKDSILIVGNKLTYNLNNFMITSSDYIVKPNLISHNINFFEKYLNDEIPRGLNHSCDYLPCHEELEACDFCYCPFYPCADGITGGEWIKNKDVWSCQSCLWIHQEDADNCIREGLNDLLTDVNDLQTKHIDLLKLRRECLLKTLRLE